MSPEFVLPLRISRPQSPEAPRIGEPVTAGLPFPQGALDDVAGLKMISADGQELPLQIRVLERWPDHSVRWALVDTMGNCGLEERSSLVFLRTGRTERLSAERLTVESKGTTLQISTGSATVVVSPDLTGLVERLDSNVGSAPDGRWLSSLSVRGRSGSPWAVEWRPALEVDESGPVRAEVVARGRARSPEGEAVTLQCRLSFFKGLSTIRVRLTVRNPRRAAHPGGIWELGDSGSVLLREVSYGFNRPTSEGHAIDWSLESGRWDVSHQQFRVYQDSSGGDNWMSSNHVARTGRAAVRFQGYVAEANGRQTSGRRATPTVAIGHQEDRLAVAVPEFWQNFPRALSATPSEIVLSLYPKESAELHELQGGEQKTHQFFLLFGSDSVTQSPLAWTSNRSILHAEPSWYAASQAEHQLVVGSDDDERYRRLVANVIDGPDTFQHKREKADEYGWRHFGDIYGDHEAVFQTASPALMSHYNNQYDAVAGFLYQFMRSGDLRWWVQSRELAEHVVDIDLYHTDEDKAAYNGGLFWHTYHYVDAAKATHRSYPRGTVGGGPSSEHNYTTGLMLQYLMSGDVAFRDAALGLAQFVVKMDDGNLTPFRWLDRGYTGVASSSREPGYHGPGRGAANSVNALLDGFRLGGNRMYLEKAEQIIRRCTHPSQDIAALRLLDPENRWFYTMYLQALGKYLEVKRELCELDHMYSYGRAVLLHFARWMAQHERPYLNHPELLEYPTETWAAQDIRKSEVFDWAASHAREDERRTFLDRAEFFFRYSVSTLDGMPTRSLCRPMVLMMVHGFRRAYVRKHGVTPAPPGTLDWAEKWPHPARFVPQKARWKRKALVLAAAGAALSLAGFLALVL